MLLNTHRHDHVFETRVLRYRNQYALARVHTEIKLNVFGFGWTNIEQIHHIKANVQAIARVADVQFFLCVFLIGIG